MDYDLIVIGAGSAGYNGAALAARQGLRVALVDGAAELGGLCILRGCMPSKALLAGANRLQLIHEAAEFGIHVTGATLDLPTLVARKARHVADFAAYRRGQIEGGPFTFVRGRAVFVEPHTLEVTRADGAREQLTGQHFLIATGSVLGPPPVPGLGECGYLQSDTALELTVCPESLVVLGAGAIALEFAHYFAALGTRVTILQRSEQILSNADADVAASLRSALEARGVVIHTGVMLESASLVAGGKRVTFTAAGARQEIVTEEIFHALGRQPNLAPLGLAAAGVDVRGDRLVVNAQQQTNVPHIYAAGDVCGPYEIVHLAIQQAEVAVRNVLRTLREPAATLETMDYRLKLFVLFTRPEVAQVGLTEAEARAAGEDFRVASYPFNDHGKSLVMGETDGFVKLLTRARTGEIIGAAVIGPEAASLIHEITVAMHYHGTAQTLAAIPHYHPTLSEIWTYPAEELA